LRNKLLVYGVLALEFTQTCLLCHTAFHSFAHGFGNMVALDEIGLIWLAVPIFSGIVAFIAQVFYAYRIRVLSRRWFAPAVIVLLAFVQLGGAIATGVESKKAKFTSKFLQRDSLITTGIWCGGSALCDIIIAAFMTYYLTRRDSYWKPTQRIVNKLVRLIIETGTLTAAIAITNLILALLPGRPTYYQTTAGVLSKLYSNAMLTVFNSRMKVGYAVTTTQEMSMNYKLPTMRRDGDHEYGTDYDDTGLESTFVTDTVQSS